MFGTIRSAPGRFHLFHARIVLDRLVKANRNQRAVRVRVVDREEVDREAVVPVRVGVDQEVPGAEEAAGPALAGAVEVEDRVALAGAEAVRAVMEAEEMTLAVPREAAGVVKDRAREAEMKAAAVLVMARAPGAAVMNLAVVLVVPVPVDLGVVAVKVLAVSRDRAAAVIHQRHVIRAKNLPKSKKIWHGFERR